MKLQETRVYRMQIGCDDMKINISGTYNKKWLQFWPILVSPLMSKHSLSYRQIVTSNLFYEYVVFRSTDCFSLTVFILTRVTSIPPPLPAAAAAAAAAKISTWRSSKISSLSWFRIIYHVICPNVGPSNRAV
jgi:hypothetical protein